MPMIVLIIFLVFGVTQNSRQCQQSEARSSLFPPHGGIKKSRDNWHSYLSK